MEQLSKKRKKGFTLIELIAVVAIIGILAAVLVPKVVGYMNDSKKSKVVATARNVYTAYGTINGKEDTPLPDTTTVAEIIGFSSQKWDTSEYFDVSNADQTLKSGATMAELKAVTDDNTLDNINAVSVTTFAK